MKALYDFIVEPLGERYANKIKIGDKELVLNTNIENHNFVSKKAVIVSLPQAYKTNIKTGDIVYVHHNIFRRYYDIRGVEKNSSTYFKDNMYFCNADQIYMYNDKCHLNYCFVKPIINKNELDVNIEQPNVGIIRYTNSSLEALKIKPGTLVTFTPNSEFEFIINDERLYCMKSNDIALIHEHKGNEREYNPSWAKSS